LSRRAHQCHRDGCDSEAVWQMWVRFMTHSPAGHVFPCTCPTTIKVCDRHQRAAAEGFVSERNMDTLAKQLRREHLSVPHPDTIKIEFARVPKASGVIAVDSVREHFRGASDASAA